MPYVPKSKRESPKKKDLMITIEDFLKRMESAEREIKNFVIKTAAKYQLTEKENMTEILRKIESKMAKR